MKLTVLLIVTLCISAVAFGQNSAELEAKKGFKEIKLLSNISTVKTSSTTTNNGSTEYTYAGDAKTIYNQPINNILIETDKSNLIKKIRVFPSSLNDDTFFPFVKQLKEDFGKPCFGCCKDNSGNGSYTWKTDKLYMTYIWQYVSWGKWETVVVIGLLEDLPADIRKMYEDPKDDF